MTVCVTTAPERVTTCVVVTGGGVVMTWLSEEELLVATAIGTAEVVEVEVGETDDEDGTDEDVVLVVGAACVSQSATVLGEIIKEENGDRILVLRWNRSRKVTAR